MPSTSTNSPARPATRRRSEQDPDEQVDERRGDRPGDDAREPPCECVRPRVDRRGRAVTVEHEDLLPVLGRIGRVEVGAPGRRLEALGQARVGEDRVAVRLDDVDRPRPGAGRIRRLAEDVDHLAGLVEDDQPAGPRQRVVALVDRAVLRRIAADDDHVVARVRRVAGRRVQLVVVDAGHEREAVGAAIEPHRVDDRGTLRGRRTSRRRRWPRLPGSRSRPEPRQRPVVDRRIELLAGIAAARDRRGRPWCPVMPS